MLAILNLNSENSFSGAVSPQATIALAISNQNYTPYWAEGAGKGENCPPWQIFKWTNAGTSTSSIRFTSVRK
jgi:hypothetical protein